ncbi:MAG: hypothetical protein JW885_13345 [Deltaproteobacteria bacterium]|nr:hypothetical protein [Candidatus Zymogenaceae bacterium]
MKGMWLLLWVRLCSAKNDLVRLNRERLFRISFFGIVGVLFLIFDYYFFYRVFERLQAPELDIYLVGNILLSQLIGMITLALFSVLIFSNIIASLSTLYLSRDLNLLLSSPLSHTRVFVGKYVQTAVNSSYMVLIFGLPIFYALGKVYELGAPYYLSITGLMIPFLIIPAGLGILVTMLLMRFFPAQRTHQVFTFLGMIFAGVLVLFFRYLKPETLYTDITDLEQAEFITTLNSLAVPDNPFLPSTWMTHVVNGFLGIEEGVIASNVVLLCAGALIAFILVVFIARHIYFSGFSQAFESSTRGGTRKVIRLSMLDDSFKGLHHTQRAIMIKDIKTFFRDPTQWSQVFLLVSLIVIYLFSIRSLPIQDSFTENLTSFLNLGLAGFVISALAVRFVFPTTSLEGFSSWIIFSSPLSMRRFLWSKFFISVFPLVCMGELLIISSNLMLRADAFFMLLSSLTILVMSVSLTALGVGMGAIFPRFNYENAAEIAGGIGGIFYMVVSLGYIGLTIAIQAWPVSNYFRELLYPGAFDPRILILSILLLLILNGIVFILPMRLGFRNLERLEY